MDQDDLTGQKIVEVRAMTDEELERNGWYGNCVVLVLSNGVKLFASQDEEGNGPGALFYETADGSTYTVAAGVNN